MVIVNFIIQDGEHEYRDWDNFNSFSKADYDKGKLKDFELLQAMYGVEIDDIFRENDNKYWIYDRLVWVDSVQDIDQPTLDILRRYV